MLQRVPAIGLSVLMWLGGASAAYAAAADNAERGRLLYENHCTTCHTSTAHIRAKRAAHSLGDIRKQVLRWSGQLELQWRAEEVRDVVEYLNRTYYGFEPE